MTDFLINDHDLDADDMADFEKLVKMYFYNRLILLEVKGFLLYGENYGELLDEALTTVFNSNMSKLGENGKPIINGSNGVLVSDKPIGKILKSENYWTPTDKLNEILAKYNK